MKHQNLYTEVVSNFIFPVHEWLKKHTTVSVRKAMEKAQWNSAAQIKKIQINRLRDFLVRIRDTVPYYGQVMRECDFDPAAIQDLSDLSQLPFLTKPLIRENTENLKAKGATDLGRFNTGGSSGEPLIFYIGNERVSHDVAAKWRATRWWDVDIGDPEIVVWGSPIELGTQDRIKTVRDKLLRTSLLPAFEMNEQKLVQFIDDIRSIKPKMLFGYPSALSHIAKFARKRGQCMDDLGIRVAFVTSERLYDEQRATISEIFGCPVANGYGGRDAGFIAHECPSGSMHITAEDIIVEIVDKEGSVLPHGEAGEIVVTHMATSHFPFVRYKTGDIGVLGAHQCECGRGLPVLSEIQGRSTDFIIAQDGTVMHGLSLIYILRDLDGVGEFKIVQESLELTRVLVVPREGYGVSCEDEICDGFRQRLGQGVTIDVEVVEQIMPEKSGKFRYVISHVMD